MVKTYAEFCASAGLRLPTSLADLIDSPSAKKLESRLFQSGRQEDDALSFAWGLELLSASPDQPPKNYLPLLMVDEQSIACAVLAFVDDELGSDAASCPVVRWHLDVVNTVYQGEKLDSEAIAYLNSVAEEEEDRRAGVNAMNTISENYWEKFIASGRQPRGQDLRPVQLACQNVIVGLAAIRHDATFDGVRAELFMTCEVAHLAAHEGVRAMAAILLCDAFQQGGTMEMRFGRTGRERPVPAALRRYARTFGIRLGEEDPCAITPQESRELFLSVTPMGQELMGRCLQIVDAGIVAPERLCFVLMSGIWSAVELGYILATSSRVASILKGGAEPDNRVARVPEMESCRAAKMAAMLHNRLNAIDAHGDADVQKVRVIEDAAVGVSPIVNEVNGSIAFTGVSAGTLPWQESSDAAMTVDETASVIVLPRSLPTPDDIAQVQELAATHQDVPVALIVPSDMAEAMPPDVPLLVCPDRISSLDIDIERKLKQSRVGRK